MNVLRIKKKNKKETKKIVRHDGGKQTTIGGHCVYVAIIPKCEDGVEFMSVPSTFAQLAFSWQNCSHHSFLSFFLGRQLEKLLEFMLNGHTQIIIKL